MDQPFSFRQFFKYVERDDMIFYLYCKGYPNNYSDLFKKIDNTPDQILSVVKDVANYCSIENMPELTRGKYINAADAFAKKNNDRPHIRSYNILLLKSQCDST